mgnify:CR=1 FL=1
MSQLQEETLQIRRAVPSDSEEIARLSFDVYGDDGYSAKHIRAQIRTFPDGQFVAESEDRIIGFCGTFLIDDKHAFKAHNWKEITANGFITRHNANAKTLYVFEVFVDKDFRRQRIGQRFCDELFVIADEMELKSIVLCSLMPKYTEVSHELDPDEYVEKVRNREIEDSAIIFYQRNGFEIGKVMQGYLPEYRQSKGHAVLMVWLNPLYEVKDENEAGSAITDIRVASVQFQARKGRSFEDFIKQVEYFIDIASDYRADFVCFPELFTLPLLSLEATEMTPAEAIRKLTDYTDDFIEELSRLALSYNVNIIGGTHPRQDNGSLKNTAYIFLRNGEVHRRDKIHPTPIEREWWGLQGGDEVEIIETDCGPIGVAVCYDTEFPEISRHLADQGALLLFAPFCTDVREGYLRVKYCCQARAVENQLYVVTSGIVGNLPDVPNMDINYAESAILTPVDFPFSRDGIAASAESNTEMIIFADLSLDTLQIARHSGTVQNFRDRRHDLYEVKWRK